MAGESWLSGWNHRKKLETQYANIDSNLSHFPLKVTFTNDTDIGADVRSDGYDIRFTTSDGETLLDYDRVYWDKTGSNASGLFYVSDSTWTLSSSAVTPFYIYYGKSDASDGENKTGVWDSNFVLVCHTVDLTTTTLEDVTGGNTLDKKGDGEPNEIAGKLYLAQEFDITDDYLNFNSATAIDNLFDGGGTISAWVQADTYGEGGYGTVFQKGTNLSFFMDSQLSGIMWIWKGFSTTKGKWYWAYASGTNRYFCITYDCSSDANAPTVFVNGESITVNESVAPEGTYTTDAGDDMTVGAESTAGGHVFDGPIEEIRFSDIERVAAWKKFEYYNMNEGDSEIDWFSEEDVEAGITIAINECIDY